MNDQNMTKHGAQRFAQRGLRPDDADLIMQIGTEVEGGYLVREKDVQTAAQQLRALLKQIEKLNGKRLVFANGWVVSGYHASKRKQKQLLKT